MEATDRLRLDVPVTGGREVYARAGASHFNSTSVEHSSTLGGKTVLQYAYEVPLEVSQYLTRTEDKTGA